MYNLPYFKAGNQQEVLDFMHQHPFITLTGVDANNCPVATHVPVLFEEREGKLFLLAHIMKHTDHHKAFMKNENVLAIFSSAHTYVSASWYTDKKQGSTWNYQTVHAKGKLRFLDNEALRSLLQKLTAHFENNAASPSLFEHLPEEYIARLMKAITAFELEITAIDHVFKLSQNKDKESYHSIINHLSQGDDQSKQVAVEMENRASNLYER